MRSLICLSPGDLRLNSRAIRPVAAKGETLVRVRRIGIGAADLAIFNGTEPFLSYPRVLGQELSGEVVKAPARSNLKVGDSVAVMPYLSCGSCLACAQGKSNCCPRGEVLGVHRDGGMAEYVAVPARFVLPTQDLAPDDAALLAFLAAGAHAVRRLGPRPGQRVLVIGADPIGMAAALFARLRGCEVAVLEECVERRTFCRDVLGIAHAVSPGPEDQEALAALTDGGLFDGAVDATGDAAVRERSLAFLARGGAYVLASTAGERLAVSGPEFLKHEIKLMGSRYATQEDFLDAVKAIKRGQVPTQAFISHRPTLAELPALFPKWAAGRSGVIKAVVEV